MTRRGKRIVGVDVYAGKWVAVGLIAGKFEGADCDPSLAALLERFPGAEVVGVDMPIGLPRTNPRECDLDARKFIGARRQSVFEAPPTAALAAPTHAEATSISVQMTGRGISRQAYGLKERILEVAEVVRTDKRLIEVHPEVSFCEMNGGEALGFSKRTWGGQSERRELLASQGVEVPASLGAADIVPVDDVLDAAAAAWSAERYARGEATSLPDGRRAGAPRTIWR